MVTWLGIGFIVAACWYLVLIIGFTFTRLGPDCSAEFLLISLYELFGIKIVIYLITYYTFRLKVREMIRS